MNLLVKLIYTRNKISSTIKNTLNNAFSYLYGIDDFLKAKERGEELYKEELKTLTFMLDSLSTYDVSSISDLKDSLKNLNDSINILNNDPSSYLKYIAIVINSQDLFKKYGAMDSYQKICEGHMSVLETQEKLKNRLDSLIKETEEAIKTS